MTKADMTRKQLLKEPDQFITFSAKLIAFGRSHLRTILLVAGIVVALLLVVGTMRQVGIRNENRASEGVEKAMANYAAALQETDATEAYERVKDEFTNLFRQYDTKKAVRLARIVFGDMGYNAGDADAAISIYTRALADFDQTPAIKSIVLSGLGHAHLMKAAYPQAIGNFETIANGSESTMKSGALFNLAWLYEITGDKEKSRATYEQLLADFPDTVYGDLVKEKLKSGSS